MQAILSTDARIKVFTAADALIGWAKLQKEAPDVVITDLEMPRMDGLTFLRRIMAEAPRPVVICSGLAASGTDLAMRALEEGAVEVPEPRRTADAVLPRAVHPAPVRASETVIAVGASTGGTEALRVLLKAMPVDCPPIVIAQHMPEGFTRAFAERLNSECKISVKEGAQGDRLTPGHAFVAPGNFHMLIEGARGGLGIQLSDGPLVSRHRPSVDVLFRSVAISVGARAIGIIMTGMGNDGAAGLLEMKKSGALTIAQDEASCAVFGMPKEAIALAAVDFVVPLERIACETVNRIRGSRASQFST